MTNKTSQHSLQANALEFAASNYFFTCLEKEYKMHFYHLLIIMMMLMMMIWSMMIRTMMLFLWLTWAVSVGIIVMFDECSLLPLCDHDECSSVWWLYPPMTRSVSSPASLMMTCNIHCYYTTLSSAPLSQNIVNACNC